MILSAVKILVEDLSLLRFESFDSLPVLGDTRVLLHAEVVVLDPSHVVSLKIVDYELVQEVCFVFWNFHPNSLRFNNGSLIAPVDVKTISCMAIHPKLFNNGRHLCRIMLLEMSWAITFTLVSQTTFTLELELHRDWRF
jgi:hypothetical protein